MLCFYKATALKARRPWSCAEAVAHWCCSELTRQHDPGATTDGVQEFSLYVVTGSNAQTLTHL